MRLLFKGGYYLRVAFLWKAHRCQQWLDRVHTVGCCQ